MGAIIILKSGVKVRADRDAGHLQEVLVAYAEDPDICLAVMDDGSCVSLSEVAAVVAEESRLID